MSDNFLMNHKAAMKHCGEESVHEAEEQAAIAYLEIVGDEIASDAVYRTVCVAMKMLNAKIAAFDHVGKSVKELKENSVDQAIFCRVRELVFAYRAKHGIDIV